MEWAKAQLLEPETGFLRSPLHHHRDFGKKPGF